MHFFKTLVVKSPTAIDKRSGPSSAGARAMTLWGLTGKKFWGRRYWWKEIFSRQASRRKTPSLLVERTPFRFKPSGWFLIFLLIWLPLAAVVTVNNFLWLVFTMIIGVLTVSHVLAKRNLASVVFFRRFPEEIYAQTLFSVRYAAKSSFTPWGSFGFTLRERGNLHADGPRASFPPGGPGSTDRSDGILHPLSPGATPA